MAAPLLVLLPGMDGTGLMFGPLLKALGTDTETQVLRYPAALVSYADCLDFARERLPRERSFVLLGESFSGPVALALAAERPPGLKGLLLCCSFARNPRPGLTWAKGLLSLLPPMRLSLGLIRLLLLGPWVTEDLLNLVRRLRDEVPSLSLRDRLRSVMDVDHTSLLPHIQVPVLTLCARRDRLVPRRAATHLRVHLPDLEIATLDGPHWLLQAQPHASAQTIRAFLERCSLR